MPQCNRKKTFPTIHESVAKPTVEEVREWANQHLYQAAARADLSDHWVMAKRNRIPSSFIFYKNKSAEGEGEWKMRLLFSYRTHPMKKYCSRMGRALTLLIKEASTTLKTFEMLHMEDTKKYFADAQQQLHTLFPDGIPNSAQLWELDVFSPHTPGVQCYQVYML